MRKTCDFTDSRVTSDTPRPSAPFEIFQKFFLQINIWLCIPPRFDPRFIGSFLKQFHFFPPSHQNHSNIQGAELGKVFQKRSARGINGLATEIDILAIEYDVKTMMFLLIVIVVCIMSSRGMTKNLCVDISITLGLE